MQLWSIIKTQPSLYYALVGAYIVTVVFLSSISWQYQVAPVWVPAGIALVGCYLFWWRFIPALFLGALFGHFIVHPFASFNNIDFPLANQMSVIALGTVLQATAGAALLRYWLGNPINLRSDKHTIGFVVLVGIVVNLISSNIGAAALSYTSPDYDLSQHWQIVTYWWLGDSIGVLLSVPCLLSLIHINKGGEESHKPHILVISTTILLFFSVTLTTLFFSQNKFENARKLVQSELLILENKLHRKFDNSLLDIQTLANFIQLTPDLDRQSFAAYAQTLIQNQSHIKAVSWNPIVKLDKINNFEQHLSQIYRRPIIIKGKPLLDQDPLVVVEYIYPELGNETAIGFNVFSDPQRKAAIVNPTLRFKPKASPIIELVQSTQQEAGFLLFSPVYRHIGLVGRAPSNQTYNQNGALLGYATGVFLVESIVASAFNDMASQMFHYQFYEANSGKIFTSNLDSSQKRLLGLPSVTTLKFDVAGQTWHLALDTKQQFIAQYQDGLTMLIFVVQLLIVAFIILLTLLMNARQTVLNRMVKDRTAELELSIIQSNSANVAKSRFLANTSHEIRTPLNAVIGFSQLAKKTKDSNELALYVNKIEQSSHTLLNIVNDILDISKIESEKLVLEHVLFDMHALLHRVQIMFEPNVSEKDIRWQVIDELPVDLLYVGDSLRIEQILINLCANAFKFTHNGHVMLKANLSQTKQGLNQRVCISIEDTGIGIEKAKQVHLFDAFTQEDTSTTRNFGGTGLGLTISRELSQLMQGSIEVCSELGKGATFRVELQLETSRETMPEKVTQAKQDICKLNVLVAEDNRINQVLIEHMLESVGIKPTLVDNGQKALEIIQQQSFDLILMDCQMPVLDGYQATAAIRQLDQFKNLPIIALTADVMLDDKQRAFSVGFNDHLSKPLDLDKLHECLQHYSNLLNQPRQRSNT